MRDKLETEWLCLLNAPLRQPAKVHIGFDLRKRTEESLHANLQR